MAGGKDKGKKPVSSSSQTKKVNAEVCPAGKTEIDLDSIPRSHRFVVSLRSNKSSYYGFDEVVFRTRALIYGAVFLKELPITSYSKHCYIHVTLLYLGFSTEFIIEIFKLYVLCVTVDGIWCFPEEPLHWIRGSVETEVKDTYPTGYHFEVGADVLRRVVLGLNSKEQDRFFVHYHSLAAMFSESIRLMQVHIHIRGMTNMEGLHISRLQNEFVLWLIKHWSYVSKLLRLEGRFEMWDPLGSLLNAEEVARVRLTNADEAVKYLGVICGTDITVDVNKVETRYGKSAIKNDLYKW